MSRALTHRFTRRAIAAGAFATLGLSGCGNQYRPVVTATNPVGPASQPTKYAVAISQPDTTTINPTPLGLLTFVDVSGDTVISTPSVQSNPSYIALTSGGAQGFTINSAGALDIFGASNPASLITSNILQTTLKTGATPVSISPNSISGSSATLFIPESGSDQIAALNSSGALLQELTVDATPVYVVAADGASRIYAVSTDGTVSSIESSTSAGLTVSGTLPVGTNPVYGVMTSDGKRAFILNKGSQSVSVINVINNELDTGIPAKAASGNTAANLTGNISIPSYFVGGNNLASNPVWADISPLNSELAVLSAGDGTHQGLLTILSIPLCSAAAQPTNPNCDSTNPVDASGFGSVLAQVPVGVNPTMVSVMHDPVLPRAYVANSGNGSINGSVSVVNMLSGTVSATLPVVADDSTTLVQPNLFGLHPTTIAAEYGTPKGKVYVTSPDSRYLSIIYTDSDNVYTHVPLYGTGIKVVLTSP